MDGNGEWRKGQGMGTLCGSLGRGGGQRVADLAGDKGGMQWMVDGPGDKGGACTGTDLVAVLLRLLQSARMQMAARGR
jgi:hypothetical protein